MRVDDETARLPFFEPRHVALAERIGAWCEANGALWAPPRDEDPEGIGAAILRALAKDGWLGFLDPDADEPARAGGDLRSLCLVREALAYADDLADYAFSIQALAATPVLRFGTAGPAAALPSGPGRRQPRRRLRHLGAQRRI